MISSVGSSSFSQYLPKVNFDTALTDEQKTSLQDILSQYDSSTITAEGMKSLMESIKAAGIPPGKELKNTMEASGFEIKPPPRPPQKSEGSSSTEETKAVSYLEELLTELLDQLKSGKTTETDVNNIIKNLQESGNLSQGLIVDSKV